MWEKFTPFVLLNSSQSNDENIELIKSGGMSRNG